MKTVYRVEGAVIKEWAAPEDEVVVRPFTEVVPPVADDVIIKGFDWNNSEYIVEQVVPVSVHEALQGGFEDLAMVVGMLCEEVFPVDDTENSEDGEGEDADSEEIDGEEPVPEPEAPTVEEPEMPEVESEVSE